MEKTKVKYDYDKSIMDLWYLRWPGLIIIIIGLIFKFSMEDKLWCFILMFFGAILVGFPFKYKKYTKIYKVITEEIFDQLSSIKTEEIKYRYDKKYDIFYFKMNNNNYKKSILHNKFIIDFDKNNQIIGFRIMDIKSLLEEEK